MDTPHSLSVVAWQRRVVVSSSPRTVCVPVQIVHNKSVQFIWMSVVNVKIAFAGRQLLRSHSVLFVIFDAVVSSPLLFTFFVNFIIVIVIMGCTMARQTDIGTFKFISHFNGYFTRYNKHFRTGYRWEETKIYLNRGQSVKALDTFTFLSFSLSVQFTFRKIVVTTISLWFIYAFVIQVLLVQNTPFVEFQCKLA